MDPKQTPPMPKKACTIDIMFPVEDDDDAVAVKQKINDAIEGIEGKRLRFQIIET